MKIVEEVYKDDVIPLFFPKDVFWTHLIDKKRKKKPNNGERNPSTDRSGGAC